ncbi:uncharacterized protein LOC130733410 [Lotus japonicus]|uniref:uncharacterized protein LOC130733410 n=1 Tax=Lotus japonicus TaxID=34305 RepID=UPI00258CDCD7|nr:uncharacterized protein LOC130733410 [Lotus japonicus]
MSIDQKVAQVEGVYEEFEPPSDWDHEEGSDTLILMLPGFKKEQLRVQVSSNRVLRLSGERQISENKWRQFRKEIPVPSDSDTNGISAKFEAGMLYVRLPKVINKVQTPTITPTPPTQEAPKPQQPTTATTTTKKPTQEAPKPQQPTTTTTTTTTKKPTQEAPKPRQPKPTTTTEKPTHEAPKPQLPKPTTAEKPTQEVLKPQQPKPVEKPTQEALKSQQPKATEKPNFHDNAAETKAQKTHHEAATPPLQELKAEEKDTQKKPQKEKGKEKTDDDVNNKVSEERAAEGEIASKGKKNHGASATKRTLTIDMLSIQRQEYMNALSDLMEEVKKQKKLANFLVVTFFVLLLGIYIKYAVLKS